MDLVIEPAAEGDAPEVERLLQASKLPIDGVRRVIDATLVARVDGRIVGSSALEIYPSGVLLRSVAVDDNWRGRALGTRLTEAALGLARRRGAKAAFLLTTTARAFFPRFGFHRIERGDVPEDVRQSVEFAGACPSSALVMRARLDATRILVLCTGNSARSQMAAGVLKSLDPHLDVQSAGTVPASRVNPYAILAMQEIGVDISGERPKSARQFVHQSFDHVVTVCDEADASCPTFAGKVSSRTHIGFPDPAEAMGTDEQIMRRFREVRDDIRTTFTAYYNAEIRSTTRR